MPLKLTLCQALFYVLRIWPWTWQKQSLTPWELHLNGSIPETSQITHMTQGWKKMGLLLSYQGSELPSPPALIHTSTLTIYMKVPQDAHAHACSQCTPLETNISARSRAHTHIYTGMHNYLDTCVHMPTNAHMHTYMDTWGIYTYFYLYTCMPRNRQAHAHTHMCALSLKHTGVCTYQI